MQQIKRCLVAGAILLCSYTVSAQSPKSGFIEKGADVNFTELANYFKAHPSPHVRKPVFDEDGELDSRPVHKTDPSDIRLIKRAAKPGGAETPHTAYLPVSPAPADTFQASASDFTGIPPDTHGAVDSNYCVTAINDSIVIRHRSGLYVSGMGLDDFWSSQETHGTGAYDPRVHYDENYHRWIMVTDCYGQTNFSTIMVAVSATSNPTGTWHMYKLLVGGASGIWLDFPCVGYNSKWVAISGNFFTSSGSFTNDAIYVFNYADMMAGTTMAYTELLPPGGSFCVAPALTYDATEPNLYCMENWDGTTGQLKLWKISGPVGSPVISSVANPSTTTHWKSQGNGGADFAPQLGSTDKLQTNDDRINNLSQRNGKLWCAHTAFLPATGTVTRASAMWWEIDTTGTPIQNGLVDDPTNSIFYAFPSIAVNANSDALMGFAYLSGTVHPSAAYSLHMHTDPNDSMRPTDVFRHGQKTYFQNFGGSDDRWGDYSGTCVDPLNNLDFWTIQESVPNYSGGIANSIWDTWWAYIKVCASAATPTPAAAFPTVQCPGTTATYAINPVTGATGYVWTVSGTGWSGTSTTTSITLTAGTGPATITVAATNSCGTSTPYTFTVSNYVAAFSIASHSTFTNTNDVFTYTGSAPATATYNWNFGGGTATPGGTVVGPQTVQWSTGGLKNVSLTVTDSGCTSSAFSDTVHVVSNVGVQQINDQQLSVSVLPNPNGGTFELLFTKSVNKPISVQVFDMQGRAVYKNQFASTVNNRVKVTTTDLPSGTYTVRVEEDGNVATNKITVNR